MILESANSHFHEFDTIKERLRNGEHLDEQRIEHDWQPYAIMSDLHPSRSAHKESDFKVTDYWYHSTAKSDPITAFYKPVIGKLSLQDLLGDEEKLIAEYEAKKEARRQRRRAEAALQEEKLVFNNE